MTTPQQLAAIKLQLQMRKTELERQRAELQLRLQSRKVERQKAELKGLRLQNQELERQKAESKAILLRHLLRGDLAPLSDPSCTKIPEDSLHSLMNGPLYAAAPSAPPIDLSSTKIPEDGLHSLMNSPLCAAALETGVDRSLIEKTLRKRLLETGVPFQTPDDLINSALASVSEHELTSSPEKEEKCDPQRNNNTPCTAELDAGLDPPTTSRTKPDEYQGDGVEDLEEKIERLKLDRACKICWEKDITVLFLPCRHMISCDTCAGHLSTCPICRKAIETSHQAYLL